MIIMNNWKNKCEVCGKDLVNDPTFPNGTCGAHDIREFVCDTPECMGAWDKMFLGHKVETRETKDGRIMFSFHGDYYD